MDTDTRALLARLERLERENRRVKWAGLALLVLAACLPILAGAAYAFIVANAFSPLLSTAGLSAGPPGGPGQTIQASEFVVVDRAGQVRARWGVSPSDFVGFGLLGPDTLATGHFPVAVGVGLDGKPFFRVGSDPDRSVLMGVLADGAPLLGLGASGAGAAGLTLGKAGNGMLALTDRAGTRRLTLGLTERGETVLQMWDAAGRPVFRAP